MRCILEQAVIVHLRLRDGRFGSPGEREAVSVLEGQLERAIESASAGEFDGDEFGDGKCILFMYGPDADRLFNAIEATLKTSSTAVGGYAIKRYGSARDPNTSEVRVTW
jgi:hypothetical protein